MSTRLQINEYLACEFGLDEAHPSITVSASWPFELSDVGSLKSGTQVLAFTYESERFFVLDGEVLTFVEGQGLGLQELELQETGSRWIAKQNPLDLGASILGDSSVPSALERRRMLLELAAAAVADAEIITGVYLRATKIPSFAELSPGHEREVLDLIPTGPIKAIKRLREITGCSLGWAKLWVEHGGQPRDRFYGTGPCPHCGEPLRSPAAKQCRFCRKDWHDQDNIRELGAS